MRAFLFVSIMMMATYTHAQMTFNCSPKDDKDVKSVTVSLRSRYEGVTTIVKTDSDMEVWSFHQTQQEDNSQTYSSTNFTFKIKDKDLDFEQDEFELNGIYRSRKIQLHCYSRGQLADL